MSVRAKFRLNSITRQMSQVFNKETGVYEPGELHTLNLSPTYSQDPNDENKAFWDASPGGELKLNCVNAAAVKQFELGEEYYIDFTKVEKSETATA